MTFGLPNKGTDIVTNKVTAGDFSTVAIQLFKTSSDLVGNKMEVLTGNIGSTDLDGLLGQMLYNIGLSYFHHLNFEEELYAKNFQMVITKEPSEAIVTSQAVTEYLWDVPYKVAEGGVGIDVDRNISAAFSIDGNQQRKKDFMIVSGLGSSSWEDTILESFLNIPSVSASRLLKIANERGIAIYTIDSGNLNTILPQLQVTSEVTDNIRNAVNAGKKVIISKSNIKYNDWDGVGYIILDPVKGSGAYMISGGLAGADPSKVDMLSNRELNDLYMRICDQKRWIIAKTAGKLIGTPYVWGGTDPDEGFDCSGFTQYCYAQAGISLPRTAADQFNHTKPTEVPLYVDLVFWKGTYDRNQDCYKNEKDGVTHVGIGIWPADNLIIDARGRVVDLEQIFDSFPAIRGEMKAISLAMNRNNQYVCNDPQIITAFNNGRCIGRSRCYKWASTGRTFESFAGYQYAPEFDTCSEEEQ